MSINRVFSQTLKKKIRRQGFEDKITHCLKQQLFKTRKIIPQTNINQSSEIQIAKPKRLQNKSSKKLHKAKTEPAQNQFEQLFELQDVKFIQKNKDIKFKSSQGLYFKPRSKFEAQIDDIMKKMIQQGKAQVHNHKIIDIVKSKNYRIESQPSERNVVSSLGYNNPETNFRKQIIALERQKTKNTFNFIKKQPLDHPTKLSRIRDRMNTQQIAKNSKQLLSYFPIDVYKKQKINNRTSELMKDAKELIRHYRAGMTSLQHLNIKNS